MLNNHIGSEISQNIIFVLGLLSANMSGAQEKINIRVIEPSSEIQKDLIISEMESKLNSQLEKSEILSNKIFSLEKQIAVLKSINNEAENLDSPAKRLRTETDINESNDKDESVNQELMTKLKIASVELEELKKISSSRLKELEMIQSEKKKLEEEIESKKEQVYPKLKSI